MTIFDDEQFGLSEVDGIEVDPQDLEEFQPMAKPINWTTVDRWCRDHPCRVRFFPAVYAQVTTSLRKRYPHLQLRATKHRDKPGAAKSAGKICDLFITHVPEGEISPFADGVPGIVYRVTKQTAERDAPRT